MAVKSLGGACWGWVCGGSDWLCGCGCLCVLGGLVNRVWCGL